MELTKEFFLRDVETVAKELLGKVLVRKVGDSELQAKIVETESYFGSDDPASRARQNGDLKKTMEMDAGTILVYGVHNNWMLNFVTGRSEEARAVLIRAIEPLNFNSKGNGPGLLTKALKIDKKFHKQNIMDNKEIWIEDIGNKIVNNVVNIISGNRDSKVGKSRKIIPITSKINNIPNEFEIGTSYRIGVTKDLDRHLRFYIKGNKFVSR
ncbi:MAG: DNA-3-methyladenine glycosylase [Nanoarchaeota archaeon]|nr:DNA-3-methyladenine glycosylase [Nanoarchaeota archaeon]